MNCDWVKTNAVLYLYNELGDDARHEMEMHLRKCADCAAELNEVRGLHEALAKMPAREPSPNLLAASRMRLQEALEQTEQKTSWKWALDAASWMNAMRFSPALAAVLLMVGFGGGVLATFETVKRGPVVNSSNNAQVASASVAAIRDINPQPGTNRVAIKYDKLVPDEAQGSLDDPQIQQLLLFAARNNYNSGVRMDSIDLLTQKPGDERIREALIFALRYDKNPGVRLKALEGLRPYVKLDQRVRDVMLEALLRDTNSGVRTEAIRALQPVTADSSVRQTLSELAQKDSNKFIKSESRRVLSTLPEIE